MIPLYLEKGPKLGKKKRAQKGLRGPPGGGGVPQPPHFLPMTLTKIHMQYESQRVNTFREKRVTDRQTDRQTTGNNI